MGSSGDKKLKQSLDTLQTRCLALYALVEAEPQSLGYLKASSFGAKAEGVRKAINQGTSTIQDVANENGGHLTDEQASYVNEYFNEHIVDVTEKTLSRVSTVYQKRFQELGMGLPFIVKKALGWFVSADVAFNETYERNVSDPEIKAKVQQTNGRILSACQKAHDAYSNVHKIVEK